jgi:hypothetical protein
MAAATYLYWAKRRFVPRAMGASTMSSDATHPQRAAPYLVCQRQRQNLPGHSAGRCSLSVTQYPRCNFVTSTSLSVQYVQRRSAQSTWFLSLQFFQTKMWCPPLPSTLAAAHFRLGQKYIEAPETSLSAGVIARDVVTEGL